MTKTGQISVKLNKDKYEPVIDQIIKWHKYYGVPTVDSKDVVQIALLYLWSSLHQEIYDGKTRNEILQEVMKANPLKIKRETLNFVGTWHAFNKIGIEYLEQFKNREPPKKRVW